MIIAINTVAYETDNSLSYIIKLAENLAAEDSNIKVYHICSEAGKYGSALKNFENIIVYVSLSNLYNRIIYQKKIGAILNRRSIDILLTPVLLSNIFFKGKQYLMLPYLIEDDTSNLFSRDKLVFYRQHIKKSIKRSRYFITSSIIWKNKLMSEYFKQPDAILILNDIKEPIATEKNSVEVSSDLDYFIVIDESPIAGSLIIILKAFSIFKKRFKSSMKLMLAIPSNSFGILEADLSNYKYRNDIEFQNISDKKETYKLIGGAYAVIYKNQITGFETLLPVILSANTPIISIEGEKSMVNLLLTTSKITFENSNTSSLAEAMIVIYKDENKRRMAIESQRKEFELGIMLFETDNLRRCLE